MFCSISGEVPTEPVVSKKTGHLYEKRIIEKYIKSEGRCPVSNTDMSEADLLAVAINPVVKPRVAASASIPGLLQMFQNEWDEVMLETYTLKHHLDSTRQELSQALYQHDAACRVIARLMRERDEARAMLSSLPTTHGSTNSHSAADHQAVSSSSSKMDVEPSGGGMSEGVLAVINDTCKALGAVRKGRKPSPSLCSKEDLAAYTCTHTHTSSHKSDKPGVTCLDIIAGDGGDVALTGGADKNVVLTDVQSGKIIATLSGHSKQVNSVGYASIDELFSCSADKTVKMWKRAGGKAYRDVISYSDHGDDVTSVSVHPSGGFVLSTSADKSWKLYDVRSGASGAIVSVDMDSKLSVGKFHPDGVLVGVGGFGGAVKLFDVRAQSEAAAMLADAECAVSSIAFSENGYTFASSTVDGAVKLWDLRKVKCVVTFEYGAKVGKGGVAAPVAFDHSGAYLAMARGTGVEVVSSKELSPVASYAGAHSKPITALHWGSGPDATSIVTVSLDRAIKVFSK